MATYPYAEQFDVHRGLVEEGVDRALLLGELEAMASAEDRRWESGQCSGTMYCGDHDHYDFLNEAFARFSHVNALQRDMCPSSTKFEAEIIAMTLDLLGARQRSRRSRRGSSPRAARAPSPTPCSPTARPTPSGRAGRT